MDFRFTPEDEALRQEAIEFTRKEWDPKGYGDGQGIYYALSWDHEDHGLERLVNEFEKKLVKKGWWTMHWPTEHGGKGASITTLRRDGWTQESILVGDELTMRCHPLKDGSRGCLLGYITLDDGSEKEFD